MRRVGAAYAYSANRAHILWEPVEDELSTLILSDAADRIGSLTGNHAQIIAMTRSELQHLIDVDDPLVESLRRDGRRLSGAELPLSDGE